MKIAEPKSKGRDHLEKLIGLMGVGLAVLFVLSSIPIQAADPVDKLKAQNMRELELKIGMTTRFIGAIGVKELIEDNALHGLDKGLEGLMKADPDLVYAIAMTMNGNPLSYVDLDGKKQISEPLTDEMTQWAKTLTEPMTKKTTYKGISVIESVVPIETAPAVDADGARVFFYIRLGFRVP